MGGALKTPIFGLDRIKTVFLEVPFITVAGSKMFNIFFSTIFFIVMRLKCVKTCTTVLLWYYIAFERTFCGSNLCKASHFESSKCITRTFYDTAITLNQVLPMSSS